MSDDQKGTPSGMRDAAERSVEQARSALGSLLGAARSLSETVQSSTKTADTPQGAAVAKGFGFAQENITSLLDFAQKLVRAPDLKSAMQLQSDFVREQADVMSKQVEELRGLGGGAEPAEPSGSSAPGSSASASSGTGGTGARSPGKDGKPAG